ncbi:type I DNA topoisomerase [Candidatus Parcubacteria bacterium]|nr:type I DNA topoisomerase [Patescibacteria group bacterium]MBU4466445.1 type I DNA topoisomerase [Patescibacteria group bacterium]MCG2688256.1 type I DNA topoisomerase [Candidatus Parcubacteria bacterium]
MRLILVESPTKSKTIKKFLGKDYEVAASYGHIRDLPQGNFGIDVKNNFKPDYVIPTKAKKTIKTLKALVKKADSVILASDEDREGEAIAWHLTKALGLKKYQRIAFHEITKPAIEKALENPREINMDLVDSQQARRVLDRIVGYRLSPFLWKKVAQGLSAGRVQSVAVRLIVEREAGIKGFITQEYWDIKALLKKPASDEFETALFKIGKDIVSKFFIKTKAEADKIIKNLAEASYQVTQVEKKETKKNPLPPFTTSTLQQEAWKKLHFPAKFTMRIAQSLYEKGLCTYHRTDSLNLSSLVLTEAKEYILTSFGQNYWPGFSRVYKTKNKSAQEAHEAIRPTIVSNSPERLATDLDEKQLKLYSLIWQRFLASQMSTAIFDTTSIEVAASKENSETHLFKATGQVLKFDGFLKVYPLRFEEASLPILDQEDILELTKLSPEQHFTQPPGRYSEASLIKALEKFGVGRPSTYAPTLETIQVRGYVEKDEKKLFSPTDIGSLVNQVLVEHFPQIVDIDFTAKMELELDLISTGDKKWVPVIEEFYIPFKENLKIKEKEVSKKDFAQEKTDEICPDCKKPLVIKISRFGKFYACSDFPTCKYKRNINSSLGIKCPKCKTGEIIERRTRKRKIFYGCSEWPKCDFALWDKPTGEICKVCQSLIVKTKWRKEKCTNADCPSQTQDNQKSSETNS